MGVSPESKGWEVLDFTDNKVVTSIEVVFYETLSLEAWKVKYGPSSGQTEIHPPTDTSTATFLLLAEVNEPVDEDVEEVLASLPPPVPVAPPLVTDLLVSTTGDEGIVQKETLDVPPTGEKLKGKPTGELSTEATSVSGLTREEQPVKGSTLVKQLVDDQDVDDKGELSVGEESIDIDVVELVVKGFTQVYGAHYDKTYVLVSSYVMLRIFLSIVAILGLNLMRLDMKNAFPQSKLDRVLYMYQPDYYDDGTSRVCKLLKSLYGLKQSLLLWYKVLDDVLTGTDWKKSQVDDVLYFKVGDDGVTCWVLVYVDDLLTASSSTAMLKELKELLEAAFGLREISLIERRISVDAYAKLTFDNEEAQERKEEDYWLKVGSLQFAVATTRPSIEFACSKLGSGLTVRSIEHWREVYHFLAYLADTRDTALEFGSGAESLKLVGYVDADDVGNKHNMTSTGGYEFVFGGAAVS
ncbi:unnamed protein product [Closterium sp. Naga37s-1]|nr:unnamed protein product [Closterium sp. Naga37s-1]